MSSMISPKFSVAEAYEDADATPRPLRIVKRGNRTMPDLMISEESMGVPVSDMAGKVKLQASMGTREEASGVEQPLPSGLAKQPKQPKELKQFTATVSPHPQAGTCNIHALHVPKQRRTNARIIPDRASSVLGSIGRVTSSSPGRTRASQLHGFTSGLMRRGTTSGSAIQFPVLASGRAVTTSAIDSQHLQRRCVNGTLLPAAASQFSHGTRPRAVTVDMVDGDVLAAHSRHLPPLRSSCTQPSLRQRLLSRVMSGVSGRSHISHAATEREAVIRQLHSTTGEKTEPIKEIPGGRARSGSIETISTLGVDLEQALAAFPTPPVSTVTSPTTISSFETSRTVSGPSRKLVQPINVATAGAEVGLLSETNELSLDSGQSVFVAVEVTGTVNPTDKTCDAASHPKGLDVAVVIDGTLYTSPAALIAHCEAARFVASLLDPSIDRLAVLTTRPQRTDPPDLNIVAHLSRTTIRMIKSVVDTIVSSTEKPDPAALAIALDCAIDLLNDTASHSASSEPGSDAYGHIFVLTANPYGLNPITLAHQKCVIHIVCPGGVPWRAIDPVICNGWKLSSSFSDSLQFMSRKKDKERGSLFSRLRNVLVMARRGKACGKVTDLVIDIEAGPNCSIEGVMGQKDIAEIRPGEMVTALVKVRVGASAAKGYTLSPSLASQASNSPSNPRDLLDELDEMLGASPAPILVAKLTYRHSLLPTGTRCSTVAAAKLKRSVPGNPSTTSTTKRPDAVVAENRIAVQKRLAYYLATHHSPRHAILSLQEHFGDHGCQSSCPKYIRLLIEELKFHARVVERFDVPTLIRANPSLDRHPSTSHTYEHFGHGLFAASNYKPQDWLIGVPDDDTSTPPEKTAALEKTTPKPVGRYGHTKAEILRSESKRARVPRPSARQAGVAVSGNKRHSGISQATSKESLDEASRIWGDMRKLSKGDRGSIDVSKISGVSSGRGDVERAKALEALAIRNKRSVGADTLMSFQGRGLGRAKENVAPWLL